MNYNYTVTWSDEDQAYIGRVAEFESLAVHADTKEGALEGIQRLVEEIITMADEILSED